LSRRATVFFSYARADSPAFPAWVHDELKQFDLTTFFDIESINFGEDWDDALRSSLGDAARRGLVLLFVGPGYVEQLNTEASILRHELLTALEMGAHMLPVFYDERSRDEFASVVPDGTSRWQSLTLSGGTRPDVEAVVGAVLSLTVG
jgi:hypothetical protein